MIFTITLTLLFLIELLILASIGLIYFYKKHQTEIVTNIALSRQLEDLQEEFDHNVLSIDNFEKQLGRLMQNHLDLGPYNANKDSALLRKRVEFIEAEFNALIEKEQGEEYWNNLCKRLSELLPANMFPTDGIHEAVDTEFEAPELDLDELDDDLDIPTLDSQVALESTLKTMAYITLNPLQNEIKRLKRIIGRHFGLISEFRNYLSETSSDGSLNKSVKELQITHVQLSRSLKALTNENTRLSRLLSTGNSATGNSSTVKDLNKERAIRPIKEPAKPKRRQRSQGRS